MSDTNQPAVPRTGAMRMPAGALAGLRGRVGVWASSIVIRATALTVLVVMVGLMASFVIGQRFLSESVREVSNSGTVLQSSILANRLAGKVRSQDAVGALRLLEDMFRLPGMRLLAARAVDTDHAVLFVATNGDTTARIFDGAGADAPFGIDPAILEHGSVSRVRVPVLDPGQDPGSTGISPIGWLEVAFDTSDVLAVLERQKDRTVAVALPLVLVLAALLYAILRIQIAVPIGTAIAAMNGIAQESLAVDLRPARSIEMARINEALVLLRQKVSERITFVERSAAAEAREAKLEAARLREIAAYQAERVEAEAEQASRLALEREREQRLLDDLRSAMRHAAQGEFGARLATPQDEARWTEIPSLVNDLMETLGSVFGSVRHTMSLLAAGSVAARLEGRHVGAFELLQRDVNATAEKLDRALGAVSLQAARVRGSTAALHASGADLADRTKRTGGAVADMATSLSDMAGAACRTATLAEDAEAAMAETEAEGQRGGRVVRAAIDAMEEIRCIATDIDSTVKVIDSIAFQTSILALNAGVEAARAGDAGRGFGVVAMEVRTLAQNVARAAREIGILVERSTTVIEEGVGRVSETGRTIDLLCDRITHVGGKVREISEAGRAQAVAAAEMNVSMREIDGATRMNMAVFERTHDEMGSLREAAAGLSNLVREFDTTCTARSNVDAA